MTSFLMGSSFLQVTRAYIKACMSLNFGQVPPLTFELSALERLKKIDIYYPKLAVPVRDISKRLKNASTRPGLPYCRVTCP